MITEKQKAALVSLRDALALCENSEIGILPNYACKIRVFVHSGPEMLSNGHHLRSTDLEKFITENPVATVPWVNNNCYMCRGRGITYPEQGVTFGGDRCGFCSSADARGLSK